MKIIFARHGESEANVERIISNRDLPHHLTAKGRQQAHTLAEQLSEQPIIALYASPILRAQQTAQILAERLHLPVQSADALREFDCGVMEGRGDPDAWRAHEAVVHAWDEAHDYDYRISDGESFNDLRTRFVPFVEGLLREFAEVDGTILLVSHGATLHHMLPLVLSNVERSLTRAHPLGNCACVEAVWQNKALVCTTWDGRQYP